MPKQKAKTLTAHRRRMKRRGMHRVELRVHKDDVELVREVASALSDPARKVATRALLQTQFGASGAEERKAYLAAAPFDGIDLARSKDTGRNVDL